MADKKVSDLPSLNGADVDPADLLYIVDSSAGAAGSKKITIGQYQLAPVSGGTANTVVYLNGSKVESSSSALTFDGTNLGIGTSLPGVRVDASGQVRALEAGTGSGDGGLIGSTASADGNAGVLFQTNSASRWNLTTAGTAGANLRVYNYALGSTVATFDSSGNLGIGASSPGVKLEVAGDARLTGANPSLSAVPTSTGFYIDNRGVGKSTIFRVSSASAIDTTAAALDSSGNLGLGVTPSAWLGAGYIDFPGNGYVGNAASYSGNTLSTGLNAYYGTGNWRYKQSSLAASRFDHTNGTFAWYTAPSGTAGNAISFTQAMTLDASGRLLIGYTGNTDGSALQIDANSVGATTYTAAFNNSSTSTSAYNVARWAQGAAGSAVGIIGTGGSAVANAAFQNNFVVGTQTSSDLAFATNNFERARITSGGDLLVGTTDAAINSGTGVKLKAGANNNVNAVGSDSTNTTSNYNLYSTGAAAYRFYVGMGGTIYATSTTITAISDQRLKENIRDLDAGLSEIMALKPRKFDWKAGKGKDKKGDRGWIAQEFEQVFPDMVDTWQDPAPEGEEPYKAVNADLIPVLVKAIQEQQALITDLRARVAALEAK